LAIAGRSNRVDIVDRLTGRIVKSIETDVARIHAVAVSADGRQLAVGGTVGSDDLSRPVIYSLETGEQLQILGPQKTTIESLLFSADGTKLCCGSRYERVQIIDVETGAATELNTDRRNEWMAQSPDGTEIAVHARPKEVLICNLRNPQRSRAITMLFNVEYCEWIPGSSLLACTNYADESIILVNAYTGRIVADLHHSGMAITAVLASAEFRKVFIGRSDGTLVSWSVPEDVFASETRDEPNLSAGERRIEALMDDQTVHLEQDSEVELQHEAIISLLLKDNLLYAAGIDGSVCVYRFPKTPTGVFRNPLERSHWPAVTFLPVSGDVLIGDANGHISRIPRSDLKFSGRGLAQLHTPSDYSDFQVVDQGIRFVDRFAVTSDDSMVGLFDHLQQVRIDFPGDNKRASRIIVPQSQPLGEIDEVAISADKKWVAWTGASRTIQILRLDVEAPIRSVPLPSAGRALCFSPDSSMLACGGNFEKLVVYQTESLEPIAVLDGCEQCTTITWGADNVSLMLGFENGGVQRRSLHQDTPEKHSVHRMRVCSIALCERDQVAISTDRSGQIALWNSESGELYGLLFEPPMIPRGTGVTYSTVRLMENRELLHHFDSGRQDVLIRRWQTKEILPAEEIHAGPMDR
jgi:WD40 repeat protein